MSFEYIHAQRYLYSFLRDELETAKEKLAKKIENKEIWIKDLCFCPIKYEFTMLHPEIVYQLEFKPAIVLGILLHKGYEKMLDNQGIEYIADKEVTLPLGEKEARGKIDIYIPEDRLLIEIKDGSSYSVSPHYILQILFYKLAVGSEKEMLSLITTSKISEVIIEPEDYNLALLQVNKAFGIPKPRAITYKDFVRDKEESLSEYYRRWISIRRPLWDWECQYCPYRDICLYAIAKKK